MVIRAAEKRGKTPSRIMKAIWFWKRAPFTPVAISTMR
jgi:hypothetical protein